MPAWARPEEPMTPVPATPSLRVAAPLLLALVLSLPSATGTASAAARDLAGRAPALEATLPSRAASATAYDPLWTGYPLPNAAGVLGHMSYTALYVATNVSPRSVPTLSATTLSPIGSGATSDCCPNAA